MIKIILIVIISILSLLLYPNLAVTIGGCLLIIGSVYVYSGNIFHSVLTYAVADLCWLTNAYMHSDLFGTITVTFGIILGMLAAFKMQKGTFRKTIRK